MNGNKGSLISSILNHSKTDQGHSNLIPIISAHWTDVEDPLIGQYIYGLIFKDLNYNALRGKSKRQILVAICIVVAGFAKILFHYAHSYARLVPECCLLICLGLIAGELVRNSKLEFPTI